MNLTATTTDSDNNVVFLDPTTKAQITSVTIPAGETYARFLVAPSPTTAPANVNDTVTVTATATNSAIVPGTAMVQAVIRCSR